MLNEIASKILKLKPRNKQLEITQKKKLVVGDFIPSPFICDRAYKQQKNKNIADLNNKISKDVPSFQVPVIYSHNDNIINPRNV